MSMLKGNRVVGIVREVYNKWERRAPLCPQHVQRLVQAGCQVLVQPSNRRVFTDGEYAAAGALVTDDLSPASVILGVKQVPVENLLPERTYVFFSHVIKAQPENMELLDHVLDNNIRLIDYETINAGGMRDGPRLVAFGGFAGRAGMIGALRGIGERMLCLGYSTPFLNVGSAYMYPSLDSAKEAVRNLGDAIKSHGLPDDFAPMTFAFTGNGNVSRGAQEIFEELPHEWVAPEDLGRLPRSKHVVYGSIVQAEHMVRPLGQAPFSREEYYARPEQFTPRFHTDFAPHVTCLVNCMYWDPQYPRLLTKQNLRDLHDEAAGAGAARGVNNTLLAVADITCDINGSVESLTKSTNIEQPFFLYDPELDETRDSLDGNGVLMCGVDILPSELPRESSEHFGDAMIDYVLPLASSDGTQAYKDQANDLPAELHGACIAANGQLTPPFSYIGRMRRERERNAEKRHLERMEENGGSSVLRISGHLFDSGFINKTLDIIEADGGDFFIVQMDVRPNSDSGPTVTARGLKSNADVQVTMPDGRAGIVGLMEKLATLAAIDPTAETVIQEMPFDYCRGEFSQTLASESRGSSAPKAFKDPPAMSLRTEDQKKVLILGAGLVAGPAAEYMSRGNHVTVVSGTEAEGSGLVRSIGRPNIEAKTIDVVRDIDRVRDAIAESDIVLSLLPTTMHIPIAEACIATATPLITASYVSDDMRNLHDAAANAGVQILCEMGLDPGMDHMSAMKIIDAVQADGGRIVHFSSLCGGLPAPEAANNPLRYKFSWSPQGVLSASQNNAKYRKNGEQVEVGGQDLLKAATLAQVVPTLAIEHLPNRDSLPYGDIYGIPDAQTIYRGTLRYAGWANVMDNFKTMGLLIKEPMPSGVESWAQLLDELGVSGLNDADTEHCLRWLGMFDRSNRIPAAASKMTIVDAFCSLLETKLAYEPHERDMVLMRHDFGVEYDDGRPPCDMSSLLLSYGEERGDTAMARTVGLTIAIGAQLQLDGKIKAPGGVLVPTTPDIYLPALEALEKEGYAFTET